MKIKTTIKYDYEDSMWVGKADDLEIEVADEEFEGCKSLLGETIVKTIINSFSTTDDGVIKKCFVDVVKQTANIVYEITPVDIK